MPSPVPFRTLRKQLEQAGWHLDRTNGSHHIFKREGRRTFVIPVHQNKVRWVYAKQVEKELGREDEGKP